MVLQNLLMRRLILSLSIVTVLFLIPSSGLATLAIPDDATIATNTLSDVQHFAKRSLEGFEKNIWHATSPIVTLGATFALHDLVLTPSDRINSRSVFNIQSRAPPHR